MSDDNAAMMFLGPKMELAEGERPARLYVCARACVKTGLDRRAQRVGSVRDACAWCGLAIWKAPVTVALLARLKADGIEMETICDPCSVKAGVPEMLLKIGTEAPEGA